jgi:hypothetical protein
MSQSTDQLCVARNLEQRREGRDGSIETLCGLLLTGLQEAHADLCVCM